MTPTRGVAGHGSTPPASGVLLAPGVLLASCSGCSGCSGGRVDVRRLVEGFDPAEVPPAALFDPEVARLPPVLATRVVRPPCVLVTAWVLALVPTTAPSAVPVSVSAARAGAGTDVTGSGADESGAESGDSAVASVRSVASAAAAGPDAVASLTFSCRNA
jgi:hypothetical protein